MARQISSAFISNAIRTAMRSSCKPASVDVFRGIAAISANRSLPGFATSCGTISRGFTSSGLRSDVAAKKLSLIYDEELIGEKETYRPSPALKEGPPQPYKLIDTDDDCELHMIRTFGVNEKISIVFMAGDANNDHDIGAEDEADEEVYPPSRIQFNFDIIKRQLEEISFKCSTDGQDFEVHGIDLASEIVGIEFPYPGPTDWSAMDEKVHEATYNYLAARGLNEDLCKFIMEAAKDKEQREYMRWLKNMQEFLNKK